MKKLYMAVSLIVLLPAMLSACQGPTYPPPPALPILDFKTHPSVLRGNWSGTILNFSGNDAATLLLTNLVATCEAPDEKNQCSTYVFTGMLQLGSDAPINVRGEGFPGSGGIYALTSPVEGFSFSLTFSLANKDWRLGSRYFLDKSQDASGPRYEVVLSSETDTSQISYTFALEPTPSQ